MQYNTMIYKIHLANMLWLAGETFQVENFPILQGKEGIPNRSEHVRQ